ncbi:MAG TPA: AAA family ATPase [Micromonospora sp.]|nr:AAA family ATPase [Micromonospora sp.]
MEGAESGWGRPVPPRWRRVLLRGRTGDQPEPAESSHTAARTPVDDPHETWIGNLAEERAAGIGRPVDVGYTAGPALPAVPARYPTDRGPGPGPADESRYVDPRYPAEPPPVTESRYAILDRGYSAYAPPPRMAPAPAETPPRIVPPQPEPSWTAPAQPEPSWTVPPQPEPSWTVPPQPEPSWTVPAQPEPSWTAPAQPEPSWTVPAQPGPRTRPAEIGWRDERPDGEVDRAISLMRRDLGGPRVIAFANPKGGVHKTTATVLAAATVGSVRGRGVLAWDDNELRGTLGLRAGSARHARTIRHLVADLALVEAEHGPRLVARLDDYLRHASDGSYDVLAGEESPRFAQRLDQHTVRRVTELLRRTYDVICVDTGNNVESNNWQTVIQAADQLVVTTVPREDAAFTADWMLDLLHETGMGELAANAVTLLSCPTPGGSPLLDDLKRHFATRTRAVAVVPYDPVLESGSSIEYAQLQHETRQAWLKAAAMMLEPFVR